LKMRMIFYVARQSLPFYRKIHGKDCHVTL